MNSNYWNGMPVIDDSTPVSVTHPDEHARGLVYQVPARAGIYEREGLALPFPREYLIDPADYQAVIEERKARKLTNRDRLDYYGVKEKNQGRIPYCWIYGPTQACEGVRAFSNQGYVALSACSGGAKIKNFRPVGGWGLDALKWISQNGLVPESHWPDQVLDRRYDTPENWALAKHYVATEWWELKSMDELVSLLLRGGLAGVGYNWWSHEVMACDVDWKDGQIVLIIRNQWKGWGDRNYGVLQGNRMRPDDTVAPAVLVAA